MTQDNGLDVSPSWQELKDERDTLASEARGLRQVVNRLGAENREIRAELDALAHIKAQWQAEALEFAGDALPDSDCHCSQWLYDMARDRLDAEKRRQAKEAT